MGSHQSHKFLKNEWLTPPEIIEELGPFDLDPCAPVIRPWDMAKKHYTQKDDGLSQEWNGKVWLNPPYGKLTKLWLNKLSKHKDGIALIFARTETEVFFNYVWDKADAVLFIKGRLHFYHHTGERAKGNAGAPSVLVAYGKDNVKILRECNIPGKFFEL
jgi:phage N-6-adenine-methyltransferase